MGVWHYTTEGERVQVALNKPSQGTSVFLCCPGPSLATVNDQLLRGPGSTIYAINTAYPHIYPDVWMGMDAPPCYDDRLWWEPFTKICHPGRTSVGCNGRLLSKGANVYFADLHSVSTRQIDPYRMFRLRTAAPALFWRHNTFTTMLSFATWSGASTIYLVGCDMGGSQDYHDGRVLTDKQRADNRRLYAAATKELRHIYDACRSVYVDLVSCTAGSPINEYIPYVPLEIAAATAHSQAPLYGGSQLHSGHAWHAHRAQV